MKKRCWHAWGTVTWAPSPMTGRPVSDTERCQLCGKIRYRVWGPLTSRSHSWWKVGEKPAPAEKSP